MSDKTQFHKGPFAIAWAVFRDDEFHNAQLTRKAAREVVEAFRPGSKHKWSIGKVGIVLPRRVVGRPTNG